MNRERRVAALLLVLAVLFSGCPKDETPGATPKTIIVTYSVLAAVVRDLTGDEFIVKAAIPNGLDPHEWEPSARDIESLTRAALIVQNGLGLEGGLEKALAAAERAGAKFFTASDHVQVRKVKPGEGLPSGDQDQAPGASDPHLWLDPLAVKAVVSALAASIRNEFGVDLSARAAALAARLDVLDASIKRAVEGIKPENRKLVSGHESLGYFAARYGFSLVGAIIPGLTTQAQVSARDLAAIKALIARNRVKVVFTELGTSQAVVEALARETGARSVALNTHLLPEDLSYFTFMSDLARTVAESLR